MLSKEELEKRKIISLNEFSTKAFCSDKPPYIYFYEKGFDACTEILWPEIERLRSITNGFAYGEPEIRQLRKEVAALEKENERLSKRLKGLGHNHVTRDIKEPGECPRCDNYHNARKVADLERKLKEIEGK